MSASLSLDRSRPDEPSTALVVCLGNDLVADDGAGCAVFERLNASELPVGTRLVRLGLGGLALLEYLQTDSLLVVVDAVQLGAKVGTVHVMGWEDLPRAVGAAVSSHGIGIREALDVAGILQPETMPLRVVLVGIEGACFDQLGGPLTPQVAIAVEEAALRVLSLLGLCDCEQGREAANGAQRECN
jgi:hydrogenase maturation protease